jgi:hypothetical protein
MGARYYDALGPVREPGPGLRTAMARRGPSFAPIL